MQSGESKKRDPLAKLSASMRPTDDELEKLRAAEGDPAKFTRLLGDLDRKYKARSSLIMEVDKDKFSAEASYPVPLDGTNYPFPVQSGFGIVGQLAASNQLACDCVVPFEFYRLDVYTSMSGPEQNQVNRGMIGAMRLGANEYTVWNPGDTTGKTRVHVWGQMHISFTARIPQAGRWYLIHPSGTLLIRGHSRVVGHGNSTTSYDAKVWVDYYQVLEIGGSLVEISGGQIHYDGTRSEDRTSYFTADRYLPTRYVVFDAPHPGNTLMLTLRIEVDTAANEDGLATGVIDQFGFIANMTNDYDTLAVKAA